MVPHSSFEAVVDAEVRRAAAVAARDVDTLAGCLHDDLVYVHGSGVRHDKGAVLMFVSTGPEFLAVEMHNGEMAAYGVAVLLHGRLQMQLRRAGESEVVTALSWVNALWVRDVAGRWQLRLFQSTRVLA